MDAPSRSEIRGGRRDLLEDKGVKLMVRYSNVWIFSDTSSDCSLGATLLILSLRLVCALGATLHVSYKSRVLGCYLSLVKEKPEGKAKARELLDSVPQLLDRKKIGGRELPTEAFIQKKSEWV